MLKLDPLTAELLFAPVAGGRSIAQGFQPNWWPQTGGGLAIPSMTNAQKLALTLVPAAQQVGALKVSGGTQDGIYTARGEANGKAAYNLLAQATDTANFSLHWETNLNDVFGLTSTSPGFLIVGDAATPLYYSLSDVATPDLAVAQTRVNGVAEFTIPDRNYSDAGPPTYAGDDGGLMQVYGRVDGDSGTVIVRFDGSLNFASSSLQNDFGPTAVVIGTSGENLAPAVVAQKIVDLLNTSTHVAATRSGLTITMTMSYDPVLPIQAVDTNREIADVTGSLITAGQNESAAWLNASDDSPASITVALATSADMIDYGQSVSVTDGFVVSGIGTLNGVEIDGFYGASGTANGHTQYVKIGEANPGNQFVIWSGGAWQLHEDYANGIVSVGEDAAYPWLSAVWDTTNGPLVLTHPAIQTLQPPSDSFVVSGNVNGDDGLYLLNGTQDGRHKYTPFVQPVGGGGDIRWSTSNSEWENDNGPLVTTDVPEPWLGIDINNGILTTSPSADPTVVVVSGAGTAEANGVYQQDGAANGKPIFNQIGDTGSQIVWQGGKWQLYEAQSVGDFAYESSDDVAYPWLATWSSSNGTDPAPTVTAQIQYPAVFVSGAGTAEANGIYTERGVLNGKPWYQLLGETTASSGDATDAHNIFWSSDDLAWYFRTPSDAVYGSVSDVPFPWLATWFQNGGALPNPTLTPITAAELAAGLRVSNDGATNGASYISQPFHGRPYYMGLNGGGSNNLHWDTDFNVWTDDVGEWTADNVAFPWQGTDSHAGHNGATFARNDVSNEANWSNA